MDHDTDVLLYYIRIHLRLLPALGFSRRNRSLELVVNDTGTAYSRQDPRCNHMDVISKSE